MAAAKHNAATTATKMKIKKGDRVQVLSGKERGQTGQVMRVLPKENRVIVEGVNIAKRHQRQTQQRVKGGIIDKDMPIAASAVAVLCSKCGPTRVGYKIKDDGTKVRICRHCGEEL